MLRTSWCNGIETVWWVFMLLGWVHLDSQVEMERIQIEDHIFQKKYVRWLGG